MIVDSHCHLQDRQFQRDREEVLRRARDAGVVATVVIGDDLETSVWGVELADSHRDLHAAVGVHPHNAASVSPAVLDAIARLTDSESVVAIGEIGLDFYRDLSPRDVQKRVFEEQLQMARDLRLPVVIHARSADEETFEIIEAYEREARPVWPKDRPLGIMHCFAGDLALARRYIKLGFVISIPGTCTYPNAERVREVAGGVPLEWMAVETDAPYLTPQQWRGKRNEPAYITETVRQIAEVRGSRFEEVAEGTALAAARVFGLTGIGERSGEAARRGR